MEIQPATNIPSRKPLSHFWPWLIVLLVLLFVGFIRFRFLEMPLERDEGEYAYAGQLILQGIPPYELAYNMKLPGTYFAYAAGMAVFGQTITGIHLTLIVVNSLTIIFVFLLGRKLFGTVAGLVACASYGILSICLQVVELATHANHFVVLFAVPATMLMLSAIERKSSRHLFFSGLLYGMAFMMKQQGMFFIVFGGILLLWQGMKDKSLFSTGFAKKGLVFAAGVFLPFAMFCLACYISGDFYRFWFWTYDYAAWYATALPLAEGFQQLRMHWQQTFYISIGFWLMTAAGLVLAVFNSKLRRPAAVAMVFWLCSFLATATGLYFRGHYFILVLPAFALLIGMSVVAMQQSLRFPMLRDMFKSLPVILFGVIFCWVITYQSQFFFELTPRQVWQNIYQLNPVEEAKVVGDYLREHSEPDSRIAVIGSEPEIYFYAHRHSATGYIYTYALMEPQSAALAMQHDMSAEIETNRPEYLVRVDYGLSWLANPRSNHWIESWADQYQERYYDPIGVVRNVNGTIVSVWGDAATNADKTGDCLIVYQRKPNASQAASRSVFNRSCPQAASISWPFSRRNVAVTFCLSSASRKISQTRSEGRSQDRPSTLL
jgi:4-amino-4-deoxy-L-arabinose transferase-like glycosyltransferase